MSNEAVYRVTEFKVCKAIASGVPLDERELTLATQRPSLEVHAVLVKMYPEKFGKSDVDIPRRVTATVDELLTYARPIAVRSGIDTILQWEYWPQACACMGPRDGNPLCPCAMRAQLAEHKAEVAARLMEEMAVGDE